MVSSDDWGKAIKTNLGMFVELHLSSPAFVCGLCVDTSFCLARFGLLLVKEDW